MADQLTDNNTHLDFDQARAKHLLFKSRLRSILYGLDVDEAPVLSHYECAVGKWIYNHALQNYSHIPEIHELEKVHANIHTSARELVGLYKENKVEEARNGLAGMEKIADRLIQLLSEAEKKVEQYPLKENNNPIYDSSPSAHLEELINLQKANYDLDEKIKQSEKEYRELIKKLPVAVYTCNKEGYIQTYNEAAEKLWGRKPESTDKWCGWWKLYDLEGNLIPSEKCPMAMAVKEGKIKSKEHIIEHPDGQRRHVIPNPQPVYDSAGNITGGVNTIIDITPQTEVKRQIEQQEQHLSNIIRQVNAGISQTDKSGKFIEINERYCELTGYTNEELLKLSMQDITHPDDLLKIEYFTSNEGSNKFFKEQRYVKKDGTIIWVSNNISRVNEPNSNTALITVSIDITESKAKEQKNTQLLTEETDARQELQNLLFQAPAIIAVLKGPAHTFELANKFYMALVGDRDIIGKEARVAMPDMEGQGIFELLDNVYKTGEPFIGNEINVKLDNGNGIIYDGFYNFVYQPTKDLKGNTDGIFVHAVDTTDQVISRKKVEESQEQFSTLANNIQNLAWIADASGWIFWYNKRWYEYTGSTFEEMEGWGWGKVHHPDHLDRVVNFVKDAWTKNKPFELTFPLRGHDGVYRWFLTRCFPVADSNGNIIRWVGTNTDIDEQKSFSAQLEEKVAERTREIEIANESLQQKNQEIALSKYNKRFLTEFSERFSAYKFHDEFFNAAVAYISELTLLDYVFIGKIENKDEKNAVIQTIALNAFGKPVDNIRYPLADGPCEQVIHGTLYNYPESCRSTFPLNKTLVKFKVEGYIGFPLHDSDGKAIGLIAIMHGKKIEDPETVSSILKIVAKRAEIEMERIKYEEALELNNEILAEKNTQLEKMNKELEEFTFISSHDLQEPLRKIQIFSSIILEDESHNLSEKGKSYFTRMQDTCKRMQQLIKDLLSFSKLKDAEGKFQITDLKKMAEEVLQEQNETAGEGKAVLITEDFGKVNVIPFQFRQLLHNLVGNAIKFSKPGSPAHIEIKSTTEIFEEGNTLQLSPGKKYVHIRFSDSGIGFDAHHNERIFKVFQRLHTKDAYPGTGIGLAIVKKIIENHHGVITAESKINEGAAFDIYIPAR